MELGAEMEQQRKLLDDVPNSISRAVDPVEKRLAEEIVPNMMTKQDCEVILKKHDELEVRMNEFRSELGVALGNIGKPDKPDEFTRDHRTAFTSYMKSGLSLSDPKVAEFRNKWNTAELDKYFATRKKDFERRGLSEGTAPEGGFLVPSPIRLEMIKVATVIDPITELARSITVTRGNSYEVPTRTTDVSTQGAAQKVKEKGTPTAKAPTLGMVTRVLHPASVYTDSISADFLEDVLEAEQILTEWAGESIGWYNNDRYINGTDDGQPQGLLQNSSVGTVTGADTTNHKVFGDDFYELLTTLKAVYRANGTFIFNSTVQFNILTLKTDDNQYLWPFSLRDGIPSTIAGKPFRIAEQMPDDGTLGNKAVIFGDIRRAYYVANKGTVNLIRDPFSSKPEEEWLWRYRHDGVVANDEAIKILVMG
jgi:HK97 family phage major capsid protein